MLSLGHDPEEDTVCIFFCMQIKDSSYLIHKMAEYHCLSRLSVLHAYDTMQSSVTTFINRDRMARNGHAHVVASGDVETSRLGAPITPQGPHTGSGSGQSGGRTPAAETVQAEHGPPAVLATGIPNKAHARVTGQRVNRNG